MTPKIFIQLTQYDAAKLSSNQLKFLVAMQDILFIKENEQNTTIYLKHNHAVLVAETYQQVFNLIKRIEQEG